MKTVLTSLFFFAALLATGQYKLRDVPFDLSQINKSNISGKQGIWFFFQKNDSLVVSMKHYRNDTLHGAVEYYWPNGQISEKGSYQKGLLDGPYFSYWKNGKVRAHILYRHGILDSVAAYYDSTGLRMSIEKFSEGVFDSSFFNNVQVHFDTVVIHFPSKWNKRYRIFKDEKLIKEIDFYKNRIGIESIYTDGFLDTRLIYSLKKPYLIKKKFIYKGGELYQEYTYDKKGNLIR